MLDMGFIHDIRKIINKLPPKRQSLFFSATMPPEIIKLSHKILGNPEKVSIKPEQTTAEKVEQALYYVSKSDKPKLLKHILETDPVDSVLVFSRTKYGADKIAKLLNKAKIQASAILGVGMLKNYPWLSITISQISPKRMSTVLGVREGQEQVV